MVVGKNVSPPIEQVNPAYTISMRTPSSKNSTIVESVLVMPANLRKLQRVVASPCFYGNENGRFDVVMVENDENRDVMDVSKAGCISVWFVKTSAFLR